MRPENFDWTEYVDDCEEGIFKSYVRAVKYVYQMTGMNPMGASPPSPKAKEWLEEFLERQQMAKDSKMFIQRRE